MIICPYCFNEFEEENALFRSLKKRNVPQNTNLFMNFENNEVDDNQSREDERLISFWETRGGEKGYKPVDPEWNSSYIDMSTEEGRDSVQILVENGKTDVRGFVRDRNNFVQGVYEKDSLVPTSTRLCPNCHNPLPVVNYGKYDTWFICVVGTTHCGKTVYLHQLFKQILSALANTGYTPGPHNLYEIAKDEKVEKNVVLPGATDTTVMRRPLAINLFKEKTDEADGITLVFYDIAGENCVVGNGRKINLDMGLHISHADAILFLIDPAQVPPFATNGMDHSSEIAGIINHICTQRGMATGGTKNKAAIAHVPTALVFTKSDLMFSAVDDGILPEDSPIFEPIPYSKEDGFNREAFRPLNCQLQKIIASYQNNIYQEMATFETRAFFAVSAISDGVQKRVEKYKNLYYLQGEDVERFHWLEEWIDGWNERTSEERKYYKECPVLQKDGKAISIDLEMKIENTKKMENILKIPLDIPLLSADPHIVDCDMTLADVIDGQMYDYPLGNGCRRVEEPLRWILWQLQIIGPEYAEMPIPPVSRWPFWNYNDRKLEMEKEYKELNQSRRAAFYRCCQEGDN